MNSKQRAPITCLECRQKFVAKTGGGLTCEPCVAKIDRMLAELRANTPAALREIEPGDRVRCAACEKSATVPTTPHDDSVNAHDRFFFTLARARAWHWQHSEACHDDMGIDRLEIVNERKPLCRA